MVGESRSEGFDGEVPVAAHGPHPDVLARAWKPRLALQSRMLLAEVQDLVNRLGAP